MKDLWPLAESLTTSLSLDRADSKLAPSQWEAPYQSNAVSHWPGASPAWAISVPGNIPPHQLLGTNPWSRQSWLWNGQLGGCGFGNFCQVKQWYEMYAPPNTKKWFISVFVMDVRIPRGFVYVALYYKWIQSVGGLVQEVYFSQHEYLHLRTQHPCPIHCFYFNHNTSLYSSPLDIWPPFRKRYFHMHFHEWKVLYFDWNFTEICSYNGLIDYNIALFR